MPVLRDLHEQGIPPPWLELDFVVDGDCPSHIHIVRDENVDDVEGPDEGFDVRAMSELDEMLLISGRNALPLLLDVADAAGRYYTEATDETRLALRNALDALDTFEMSG